MNICKDCKYFGGLRMGPTKCENPTTMIPNIVWGPQSIVVSQARGSQQPCGPEGALFEPSKWVRAVALFKAIGGFV